jgi:GNAT superfamily N-acetyltransferase
LLTAPVPIAAEHDLTQFDCGKPGLNDWLKQRALKNESRASRCFVTCEGRKVVGYYCLAAGSVRHAEAPSSLKRNMPPEIPVLVIGRMAVDLRHQGHKLGAALMADALRRCLNASRDIGAAAVLVHAIDRGVVPFYAQYGFQDFPSGGLTLFLPMKTLEDSL